MEDYPQPRKPEFEPAADVDDLMVSARKIVNEREATTTRYLTTGYAGIVDEGDRVLIAVRNLHNERIVEAIARAFRENDVKVDVITVDIGPDEERTEAMDVELAMTDPEEREEPEEDIYSQFLGKFWWVEELAVDREYDLLIQSTAGPFSYRYPDAHLTGDPLYMERLPWQTEETFMSEATFFPKDLLRKIGQTTRSQIWEHGPGATARITDPEGTELTYTLWEEYFRNTNEGTRYDEEEFEEHYGARDLPLRQMSTGSQANHMAGHPYPPLVEKADTEGVIASTLGHHSKPYPRLEMHFEDGVMTKIEGGGEKGDLIRQLHERTEDIQYPDYPRPGLFWFWEMSIGTNPKVIRPDNILMKSEPGTLTERLRSGYVHLGVGTHPGSYAEPWAEEQGYPYGHVDQHLNFPTFELEKPNGETVTIIEKGHLTALDDPEVRELAAEYGDPDELLRESWVPPLPGVNAPGEYDDYAENPADYIDHFDHA